MMPFRSKKYYRHKAYRDTFIEVVAIRHLHHDGIKLKVMHYNFGCEGKPWPITKAYTTIIHVNDYKNWEEVTDITRRPE